MCFPLNSVCCISRSADSPEVYHEGHGSSAADWPAALFCNPNVCHHRPGVLQRQTAQHLRTTAWNIGYSHTHCMMITIKKAFCADTQPVQIFPYSISHRQEVRVRDVKYGSV